jgi:LacI family transcriptional regulator
MRYCEIILYYCASRDMLWLMHPNAVPPAQMAPRTDPPSAKRVAVVFYRYDGYERGMLRGIRTHVGPTRRWSVRVGAVAGAKHLRRLLTTARPAGVICELRDVALIRALRKQGVAVVRLFDEDRPIAPALGVAQLSLDNEAVGAAAARHLLDRGYHLMARVTSDTPYARARDAGFCRAVTEAGFDPGSSITAYNDRFVHEPLDWAGGIDRSAQRWLAALPKPVAVFAVTDRLAAGLTDACAAIGLRVPEDVSIVGVDDDPLLCPFADPPLSSVALPWERIGAEAARMLDHLMAGGAAPVEPVTFGPIGVTARRSTDLSATADPDVASAVRFLRARSDDPRLGISDVAREVGTSRRRLEQRFRAVLGRSPVQELRRLRVEEVKALLLETDLSMPAIATRCGFANANWMATVFRQATGTTATAYRRSARVGG